MAVIANRYEIQREIDHGGMGSIICCRDLHLQRDVILKRLQPGVDNRRLLDEQKALAKLRSKHVVQLYDIVNINENGNSVPAIVLEYIDGKTLEVGIFTISSNYYNIIWQISCGLSDIHKSNIIHRDIKPSNIKIDKENVVKILDFGLSRSIDNSITSNIIGTPIFMAPELWGNNAISFDTAVDVYAFGVTCLALLSSQVPQSMQQRPPSQPSLSELSDLFSAAPEDISRILFQCLNSDPSQRPSMLEIRDLFARYLLRDKHRATVVLNNAIHTLDKNNRTITLNATVGNLVIEYDGLDFKVKSSNGAVFINNTTVKLGSVVPGCCVLTFGNNNNNENRKFVTFDVSHPEVMS